MQHITLPCIMHTTKVKQLCVFTDLGHHKPGYYIGFFYSTAYTESLLKRCCTPEQKVNVRTSLVHSLSTNVFSCIEKGGGHVILVEKNGRNDKRVKYSTECVPRFVFLNSVNGLYLANYKAVDFHSVHV